MSKFTKGGFTQTCTYDANGIRTEKIENGKTHKYYVEDSQIVREVVTGSENYELYYLYGATGIAGFTHKTANGSTNYYYRKNLLGDVTAIYDAAGVCKAEYAYDAWGNCTVNSDMGGIGALNPIRYRGYYWDEEIALYYLNARYYDPEVGRFISQDSIKYLAPETLNGINLFAYCLNNPVMGKDPQGTLGVIGILIVQFFWTLVVVSVIANVVAVHESQEAVDQYGDIGYPNDMNVPFYSGSSDGNDEGEGVGYYNVPVNISMSDKTIMEYVNYLYAQPDIRRFWTKEELYREIKYHCRGLRLPVWEDIKSHFSNGAGVEVEQTFATYIFRFAGNTLILLD